MQILDIMTHHERGLAAGFELTQPRATALFEKYVPDSKDLVEEENVCRRCGGDGKPQAHTHARGIALEGQLPMITELGEFLHAPQKRSQTFGANTLEYPVDADVLFCAVFFVEPDAKLKEAGNGSTPNDTTTIGNEEACQKTQEC